MKLEYVGLLLLIVVIAVVPMTAAAQKTIDMAPFTAVENENGTVTIIFNDRPIALFANMHDAMYIVNSEGR